MRLRSLRLAARLARGNLRRRPAQALLLLLALTIATGVLGVAASVADAPWDRVWQATRGFHVGLGVYHPPDEPGNRAFVQELHGQAARLATAPGVVGVGGPGPTCTGRSRSPAGRRTSPPRSATPAPTRSTSRW